MSGKFDYDKRIWGFDSATLSPTNWAALKLKYALNALNGVKGKILDVGCGGGVFTRGLKNYRPDLDITGVDISRKSLDYAKSLNKNIKYKFASIYKLPFKDGSFDAVLAFDVLEHLEKPDLAVKEISRVLKPSGMFHSATPIEGSLANLHGWYVKIKGESPKRKQIGHINQFTKKSLYKLFFKHDLEPISFNYTIHLFTQVFDLVYNFYLLRKAYYKTDPSFSVEKYVSQSKKDAKTKLLLFFYKTFVTIHYLESLAFRRLPGLTVCITALKKRGK